MAAIESLPEITLSQLHAPPRKEGRAQLNAKTSVVHLLVHYWSQYNPRAFEQKGNEWVLTDPDLNGLKNHLRQAFSNERPDVAEGSVDLLARGIHAVFENQEVVDTQIPDAYFVTINHLANHVLKHYTCL